MYIRHIDHRSGAPWGPHGREGGKKYSRQSREKNFLGEKGPHGGPRGMGPHGGPRGHGPQGPKDPGLKDPGPPGGPGEFTFLKYI